MGNNIIMDSYDRQIGFAKDLRKMLMDEWHESIDRDDYETAKDVTDLLADLQELESQETKDTLYVISDNNGMGLTVTEYKNQKKGRENRPFSFNACAPRIVMYMRGGSRGCGKLVENFEKKVQKTY